MKAPDGQTAITFQIKPYEIDAAGHVNNAVYLNWLEDLRVKLFSEIIPLKSLTEREIFLVVASTSIRYRAPLFLYNKPLGILNIDNYSKGIWYLSAKFIREDRVIAEASQKCVLIDRKRNKMLRKVESIDADKEYESIRS